MAIQSAEEFADRLMFVADDDPTPVLRQLTELITARDAAIRAEAAAELCRAREALSYALTMLRTLDLHNTAAAIAAKAGMEASRW